LSEDNRIDDVNGGEEPVAIRLPRRRADLPELEQPEIRQGMRPGQHFVRIMRPRERRFEREEEGTFRATERAIAPRTGAQRLWRSVRRIAVGRTLSTEELEEQRLPKIKALAVFSSDVLSSSAYATDEILIVLAAAGTAALRYSVPLAVVIAGLLGIVTFSYRQTIKAYPNGGGAYIVARGNLGDRAGLTAAAALLVDYVLTVAVSISAGVLAITSAFPGLSPYSVELGVACIGLITLANLRGVKESGTIFAVPTYGFIISLLALIGVGLFKVAIHPGLRAPIPDSAIHPAVVSSLSAFLLLRAFASGCTALTGTEAISNGVPAFKKPEAHNAALTLMWMAVLLGTLFIGLTVLADRLGVQPSEEVSVPAQVGKVIFGTSPLFYTVQAFTALILILAANTSYQDFPRLSSILARDRYMPRQFMNRGDRLVFSNGVVMLAVLSSVLIILFNADVTKLIQLYVVGVFTSFTLSQSGMVRHWLKTRERGWKRSAVINGIGAFATGLVLVVVTMTKFMHGAYIVVIAIPIIVLMFKGIHRHYGSVGSQLRSPDARTHAPAGTRAVVLVPQVDASVMRALGYARALRPLEVRALFVGDEHTASEVRAVWESKRLRVALDVVSDGDFVEAVRRYVRAIEREGNEFVTVVVPEPIGGGGFRHFVRHRKELMLKAAMLFEPQVVLTDVPSIDGAGVDASGPIAPARNAAVVLVSGAHNATFRALDYAKAIRPTDVRAVTFNVDDTATQRIMHEWSEAGTDVALEVLDSPYREVTRPLLRLIRQIRATTPDCVVTVIVPEFVVKKWWHQFLHNQTALAIKAALLFEPGVVLTSVPYHLE